MMAEDDIPVLRGVVSLGRPVTETPTQDLRVLRERLQHAVAEIAERLAEEAAQSASAGIKEDIIRGLRASLPAVLDTIMEEYIADRDKFPPQDS